MDQLWILARIPDSACLDVRILGPRRNLDHRSFFSLDQYANEFIQIISFFQRSSFKLLLELYCVIVIKHVALFTNLCKINNGIHIYQFTFELLHFFFQKWLWFQIWTKILADRRIWRKKRYGSADLHNPIHPLFHVKYLYHGILTSVHFNYNSFPTCTLHSSNSFWSIGQSWDIEY